MKLLLDIYEIETGLDLVNSLERLNLKSTDVQSSVTPVVITAVSNYFDSAVAGFYTTIKVQLSSLILCGFERFHRFVKEFNACVKNNGDLTGRCDALEKVLDDAFISGRFPNDIKIIPSISNLIDVLKGSRIELQSFIECLKEHRPVELTKDFDCKFLDKDCLDRFYIGYLKVSSFDYNGNKVMKYGDYSLLGSVTLPNAKHDSGSEEYIKYLQSVLPKIESFDLNVAAPGMFKKLGISKQQDVFSTLYDLIYLLLEDWGC